jgi:hypothetical protein
MQHYDIRSFDSELVRFQPAHISLSTGVGYCYARAGDRAIATDIAGYHS